MLVGPFQANRPDVVSRYDDFLRTSENLTVVPVGRAVLLGAARQRARLRLLMPDAIHVATALEAGCDLFLTNDRRLRLPAELTLHLI
jgi:predicted nucleic acid-binding protein